MLNARISGIASYLPDDILDNEMLSKMVDTNDEWITTRVGIKERRILKRPEGSSWMGIQAVNKLLAEKGINPEEIELLICATSNPDYRFPSTASVICQGTGLKNAYGYDIQAACAGFIVALEDAAAYIKSGLRKKVLVVCTEKMSSMVNYQDRATCPLFGDGAACVLVEPTEEEGMGVRDAVFHVDGRGLEHLVMWGGGSAEPTTQETLDAGKHFLFQDGKNVYKNAVTDMYTATIDVMNRNGLTAETIDWMIPHQANLRIIEAVGSRAGIPTEKVMVNIQHTGNTSAASIPICLDEFKDKLHKGDKLILTAFGAGFTWGAMYLVWDM
ncbi:MAG: ketoacyl-ACP synthase III [[Clostridium] fimetarium]|nr:ketoacyl-ACP synthase III [Alistipes timonensis]MCM1405893.1 ketoacyl-ACP synthase III [[Clostridium] fimetarium]